MRTKYKFIVLITLACLCSIGIYNICEKPKSVNVEPGLVALQRDYEKDFSDSKKYTSEEPLVVLNPYGISPLTALIIFETPDLTTPVVTIVGKDSSTTIKNTFKPGKVHYLPVYGLYPDKENEVILTVNGVSKTIKIQTEKLPENFDLPTTVEADRASLKNELYFVTPASTGYNAAYDINGDVRWYLSENFAWNIKRLRNGHILVGTDRLINPPYYLTGLYEMDLLGKIYYEYSTPGGYHHDYFEMENGDLLIASDDFKNGTVEDYLVLLDRETGKVKNSWDLKEIFPSKNEGYNENYTTDYDWFHNNSVWYDKKTNSITLSGRHVDAVVNIDYDSSDINWIVGDKTNWSKEYHKYFYTPIGNLEWPYAQHSARLLPNGNLSLFDNGNNRSKDEKNNVPALDNYSRAVIYEFDHENKKIQQIYEYGKALGSSFYSPYISDMDCLGNNHYLINSGGINYYNGEIQNIPPGIGKFDKLNSVIVEVLNNKEIFKMELPTNTYRAEKMSLYANDVFTLGDGVRLGSLGETKVDSRYANLLFPKNGKDILEENEIKITKEDDRLVFSGRFKKNDKVKLIVDNVFRTKVYNMTISKRPYTAMCIDIFNEEETENGIVVTKYVNSEGLSGKYYLYVSINGRVYDLEKYLYF